MQAFYANRGSFRRRDVIDRVGLPYNSKIDRAGQSHTRFKTGPRRLASGHAERIAYALSAQASSAHGGDFSRKLRLVV